MNTCGCFITKRLRRGWIITVKLLFFVRIQYREHHFYAEKKKMGTRGTAVGADEEAELHGFSLTNPRFPTCEEKLGEERVSTGFPVAWIVDTAGRSWSRTCSFDLLHDVYGVDPQDGEGEPVD